MSNSDSSNPNKLGFLSIYLLGINSIIGSGIFLLPGNIYNEVGVSSLFVIVLASILVLFLALCYAEASSKFSENGSAWLYSKAAFGDYFGFQVGYFSWILGVITWATEVAGFLTALTGFIPSLKNREIYNIYAISICIVLSIINYFGVKFSKFFNNISSVAKIISFIFFIAFGVFFMKKMNFNPIVPVSIDTSSLYLKKFGKSLGVIFYAYAGFSFLPIAAKNMKNPKKNIPKALIAVVLSCSVIYFLVTSICIGVLGNNLANATLPTADVFKSIFGQMGYNVILASMLIAIGGIAIAISFDTPIIASSLSTAGLLPKAFGKKSKFNTPSVSIVFTGIFCILLLLSGDFIFLASLAVVASFIQNIPTALCIFKLRNDPKYPNSFTIPFGPLIPGISVILSFYLLSQMSIKIIALAGVGLIIGTIFYFICNHTKRKQEK
ncbi:APC family permease [uncultured Cetobacterium sp.]|uniref:APC family permease n=1 Tax=uncultured Cetobacterium sp. TaxID=527638 RepID=UPI00260F7E25|nr:APC family permease [uncultured Cetobacterium sp.]